jgi:hypothetical protein
LKGRARNHTIPFSSAQITQIRRARGGRNVRCTFTLVVRPSRSSPLWTHYFYGCDVIRGRSAHPNTSAVYCECSSECESCQRTPGQRCAATSARAVRFIRGGVNVAGSGGAMKQGTAERGAFEAASHTWFSSAVSKTMQFSSMKLNTGDCQPAPCTAVSCPQPGHPCRRRIEA